MTWHTACLADAAHAHCGPFTAHSSAHAARTGLGLLLGLLLAGCTTAGQQRPGWCWMRRGPCPESLLKCRELSQQGLSAMQGGDWPAGERLLAEAVRTAPEDCVARVHYAQTLWHRGDREGAVAQLGEAVRLAPEQADAHRQLAEYQLVLGNLNLAHKHVEEAIRLEGLNPEVLRLRGDVLVREGQPRQALADYHRALSYRPNDPELLYRLAMVYLDLGEPRRAWSNLLALSDRCSPGEETPELLALLGRAAGDLGRHDDAARYYQAAAQRGGNTPATFQQLAGAQLSAGRIDDARASIHAALALDPAHPASRALLARIDQAGPRATASVRR